MDRINWDRWAPASGLLAAVCWVVTFFLPPKVPPNAGDPGSKLSAFITDHRTALLIGAYVGMLGVAFFVWFLGSLVTTLRDRGEPRIAAIAYGAGLLGVGFALYGFAMQAGLAWSFASEIDGATAKTLVFTPTFAFPFPLAVLAAASAIAAFRSRIFPQWYGWLGVLAATWFVIGGAALARNGFFSPAGAYGMVGLIAFFVWLALTSMLIIRSAVEEVPTTAAIPAA